MDKEKSQSATNSQRSSSTRENPPTPPPEFVKELKKSDERGLSTQTEFSEPMQRLLGFEDRRSTFYKTLEDALTVDYARIRNDVENDRVPNHLPKYQAKDGEIASVDEKTAYYCNLLKNECYEYIEPLHEGLGLSIAAAIETHTAFAHLNKLQDLLDKICDMLDQNYKMQIYMQDLKTWTDLKNIEKKDILECEDLEFSDPESDLETNISLLNSILEAAKTTSSKRNMAKQRARERSKSVFVEGGNQPPPDKDRKPQPPLRRQSAFIEGKAKVSKWTKVKAAFKWEKANVPALNESKSSDSGIGLIPVNHEVARYLRVPSLPGAGSSADSVLSSSSGHLLSETGTPGTISSASSVDDIERASQSTRRDSSKSDSKCDSHTTVDVDNYRSHSIDGDLGSPYNRQELKDCSPIETKHKRNPSDGSEQNRNSPSTSQGSLDRIVEKKPIKSSSLKGMRKSKVISDFEALPEDVIVDVTSPSKRTKTLPTPLNLNLRQDLSESDYADISQSPSVTGRNSWEKSKNRKLQSPGNSSVPSSPSRHSEFFPEFESEDLSSGDFSEPTTPHSKLFSNNRLHMQQEEINQRYIALRERLNTEFEAKRQEWDKIRHMYHNSKISAYHLLGKDDPSQQQVKPMSTKLLEENLTPDFKKKLHKWRVKKQISLHGISPKEHQSSPTKDAETKKIDWNLWRTGQIKLDGQGLSPLPDQKDLPEEFQKKLEQWNKIKSSGPAHNGHDFMKRATKLEPVKKTHDEEKQKPDKDKPRTHERDKLEKLSKLKSIVADPKAKEIEVKTTAGVMKFEGISRKFTRKLYEWEKARGIGPESSTFALLHPGYCPLDVDKIPKEGNKNESSPTLSRSLSLDSVSPTVTIPVISRQTSSLSLNHVDDLNEAESTDAELKVKLQDESEEPEAVMVEVEDHIVETASPLVAVVPLAEHRTPVYRYAEVTCSDFCKSRSVQSFESHHNNTGDKIKTLNYINDLWLQLESKNEFSDDDLSYFQTVFSTMRGSFSDFENNLSNSLIKQTFFKAKELVEELYQITKVLQLDEACCNELINERQMIFRRNLDELHKTLNEVRQQVEYERNNNYSDLPEINVTTSDDCLANHYSVSTTLANTAVAIATAALTSTLDGSDDVSTTVAETNEGDIVRKPPTRNFSNGSGKKKLRLRKIGSRQNSKTESDSSDGECGNVLETPRRIKRRASNRLKQRSLDEERKSAEDIRTEDGNVGDDIVYVLKVKPGQPIEQQEISHDKSSKLLISPTETCVELIPAPQPEALSAINKSNIFVKTKRKVFTTVEEPGSTDKLAVVATELDGIDIPPKLQSTSSSVAESLDISVPANCLTNTKSTISPGIRNMISKLCENMPLEKLASSSSLTNQSTNRQNHIVKSVSAGNIFIDLSPDLKKTNDSGLLAKSLSFVSLKQGWEYYHTVPHSLHPIKTRIPLANDSFRIMKRNGGSIKSKPPSSPSSIMERREHLFRKNKSNSPVVKVSRTGKRIETKLTKSATAAAVSAVFVPSPDKSDNTVPRITRKLENKCFTPTCKSGNFDFKEALLVTSASEPSTPMNDGPEKPRTPLSERAMRLQKAKEEFLQGGSLPKVNMRRDESSGHRNKEKWENRHSNQSMGSELGTGSIDERVLLKSVSVGMLPADSDCSEALGGEGGYDSLPRSVSRSGKFTSKLGFATLASKFRRVKLRRGSKENNSPMKGSALSILCRQSLFVDLNSVAQQNLMKSQSSQAAIGGSSKHPDPTAVDKEKLNKSKSDNYFPHRKKESYV